MEIFKHTSSCDEKNGGFVFVHTIPAYTWPTVQTNSLYDFITLLGNDPKSFNTKNNKRKV